ncbi:hypothetical protein SOASR030_30220 [Leminorella grimontii]|uniref:DUF3788 domain-containing protein n=1 Tax=Leminorella grimontii TaxID=82981 RepID=A0AAV5N469_9GAMM|nr:DUF3788 domain-containing protein [Leminorella grimontii]KFC94944.1 hypothetical protein GLGR_2376 [Leminorella grimontii ATCC 33999 = DSM 5078]GKX56910.1 hypothetical protein SOASR030_30220 [Leminorella grimontii]VFS61139.1 Protein of uncharacterised function (DUF3788) [Leminorella grimontii]
MVIETPNVRTLQNLLGNTLFSNQKKLIAEIESRYSLENVWHTGGKEWTYELKFRKGSKTVCSLLFNEEALGFMVVFGKPEQAKFEALRGEFSAVIVEKFDAATAYHDGKWLLFDVQEALFADFMKLLGIKRRVDKKDP